MNAFKDLGIFSFRRVMGATGSHSNSMGDGIVDIGPMDRSTASSSYLLCERHFVLERVPIVSESDYDGNKDRGAEDPWDNMSLRG